MEKYDPIRIIGEGSFGKVYLMRDKINRKFVCVKVIKIKNIAKKEREATKSEVDLLKRLHHPNIVRYVDSFLSKNHESLCIVMEYCDGGDLASQIKSAKRKLFSEDKILHWFVQITLGLNYMHMMKVLHRDLKTQNIFLLGNGRLVLGDLGISKVLEGTMDFAQTCIGTPYYMSPEIFKNKPYSYKSDIWALGCVLYEMTTLCHAFDAQSLNGLAQKIIKGSYPSIHHKYSRYLKELISEMLSTNPQQRPDTDQILKKPFIQKHIVNLFVDIASRPQQSLGDGTMIVRAAAGGPLNGFGSDVNMLQFRQQLQDLGLNDAIQKSLNYQAKPKDILPSDPIEAKKIAKEAASALKREEEHKRIVESALEKLKQERENRAKERERLLKIQREKEKNNGIIVGGINNSGINNNNNNINAIGGIISKQQQQQISQKALPQNIPNLGGKLGGISSVAEINSNRKDQPLLSARDRNNNNDQNRPKYPIMNNDPLPSHRDPIQPPIQQQQQQQRGRSIVEEQREKRRAAELIEMQEKKRDAERRAREFRDAERLKEEIQRERDEAAIKQQKDFMKAQADAQKREQQLYLERERQRAAIEQLARDKVELDRRVAEQDRRREERLREEKSRLDNARAEQLNYYSAMNKPVNNNNNNNNNLDNKADDKEAGLSAYERVMASKKNKQLKEEQQYYEQIKQVEADNRVARQIANNQNRQQIFGGGNGDPITHRINNRDLPPSFEFEMDDNKNQPKKNILDNDDLIDRLPGSRFDHMNINSNNSNHSNNNNNNNGNDNNDDDDEIEEEDDDNLFINANNAINMEVEEEEDLRNKEEELLAELNHATMRVSDLKQTLQNTKTYYDAYRTAEGRNIPVSSTTINKALKGNAVAKGLGPIASTMDSDEDDEEDDDKYGDDEEEEIYDELPNYSVNVNVPHDEYKYNKVNNTSNVTNNNRIVPNIIQSGGGMPPPLKMPLQPPSNNRHYQDLQDPPSPSGKLADRIFRTRQKCIENFGRDLFDDVYRYIRCFNEEDNSSGYEENIEDIKLLRIRSIAGDKARYIPLIEQLIFMEDTNSN